MGDLFSVTADGGVHAVLRRAAVPVRAVVAPLGSGAAADALAAAVGRHLEPLLPAQGVWMQDRHIYHTTLFHASPHKVCPEDMTGSGVRGISYNDVLEKCKEQQASS